MGLISLSCVEANTTVTTTSTGSTSGNYTWYNITSGVNRTFYVELPKDIDVIEAKINISSFSLENQTLYKYLAIGANSHDKQPPFPGDNNTKSYMRDTSCQNGAGIDGYVFWSIGNVTSTTNVSVKHHVKNLRPDYCGASYPNMACLNISDGTWQNMTFNKANPFLIDYFSQDNVEQTIYLPYDCVQTDYGNVTIRYSVWSNHSAVTCEIYFYDVYLSITNYGEGGNVTNPFVAVGDRGNKDWFYTGEMNHTRNRTLDISSAFDAHLLTCTANATGYCSVPITFNVSGLGRLEWSDLDIVYQDVDDPVISSVDHTPSCIEITGIKTWSWVQTEDDWDGEYAWSNCTWTSPTSTVYRENSSSQVDGAADCAKTMDESGTWNFKIYLEDKSGRTATASNDFVVQAANGCAGGSGDEGGGGGGGFKSPTTEIIYVCEEGYQYNQQMSKCEPIPLEQLEKTPAIFSAEEKFLSPVIGQFSVFHILLGIGSVVAIYQFIFKRKRK